MGEAVPYEAICELHKVAGVRRAFPYSADRDIAGGPSPLICALTRFRYFRSQITHRSSQGGHLLALRL
jgi:hypothetical protein